MLAALLEVTICTLIERGRKSLHLFVANIMRTILAWVVSYPRGHPAEVARNLWMQWGGRYTRLKVGSKHPSRKHDTDELKTLYVLINPRSGLWNLRFPQSQILNPLFLCEQLGEIAVVLFWYQFIVTEKTMCEKLSHDWATHPGGIPGWISPRLTFPGLTTLNFCMWLHLFHWTGKLNEAFQFHSHRKANNIFIILKIIITMVITSADSASHSRPRWSGYP